MSIRIDMSDLIRARRKLAELQQQKVLELTQKLTLDVGRRLIEGSPVDTGAFRGAWEIETPTKPGESGRVSNASVYGPALAKGHSDQAPNGWIEDACEAAAKFGGRK